MHNPPFVCLLHYWTSFGMSQIEMLPSASSKVPSSLVQVHQYVCTAAALSRQYNSIQLGLLCTGHTNAQLSCYCCFMAEEVLLPINEKWRHWNWEEHQENLLMALMINNDKQITDLHIIQHRWEKRCIGSSGNLLLLTVTQAMSFGAKEQLLMWAFAVGQMQQGHPMTLSFTHTSWGISTFNLWNSNLYKYKYSVRTGGACGKQGNLCQL